MSIYSKKQKWKIFLIILALLIIGASFWYSNHIVNKIRTEERKKIELWSQAIKSRANLVQYTKNLFEQLEENEQKSVEIWTDAMNITTNNVELDDYTFVNKIIQNQVNIPMILVDEYDKITNTRNLDPEKKDDPLYVRQQLEQMKSLYPPLEIQFFNQKQYLYYKDSKLFSELRIVMDDLINSFFSETVINSASVPVILTTANRDSILNSGNVDVEVLQNPERLENLLRKMSLSNEPIEIDLGAEKTFIYYEDSVVLKQLKFFPFVQFLVIGLFLMISYLLFSTFRKSEQNQVWVGMAKETAHQLGTPLSALMAWMDVLKARKIDEEVTTEMSKDISRLETITERFSKIGSTPDLKDTDIKEALQEQLDYFNPRTSKKIVMSLGGDAGGDNSAMINKALFGWVIENLIKNAIDAMGGEGKIHMEIVSKNSVLQLDISDTGKGVPQNLHRTIFQPGYTTKKRGWGLGLSLTKRIIETYHHGKIFIANSAQDKGTTFRIILNKGSR